MINALVFVCESVYNLTMDMTFFDTVSCRVSRKTLLHFKSIFGGFYL